MADIRLPRLPDRTPVRLTLSVSPELHRSLTDYAHFYREAYGETPPLSDLIPAMIEGLLVGDKGLRRRQRRGARDEQLDPSAVSAN